MKKENSSHYKRSKKLKALRFGQYTLNAIVSSFYATEFMKRLAFFSITNAAKPATMPK